MRQTCQVSFQCGTIMLNILSFADVRNKFRVTMDTEEEPAFIIHLPNGNTLKFKEVSSGLYLYDYKNPSYLHENTEHDYSFLIQSRLGEHNFT